MVHWQVDGSWAFVREEWRTLCTERLEFKVKRLVRFDRKLAQDDRATYFIQLIQSFTNMTIKAKIKQVVPERAAQSTVVVVGNGHWGKLQRALTQLPVERGGLVGSVRRAAGLGKTGGAVPGQKGGILGPKSRSVRSSSVGAGAVGLKFR